MVSTQKRFKRLKQYQPGAAGGTRSPPVTPHHLQDLTARLTLFPKGCQFPSLPGGGGGVSDAPPLEIKEGVVLGPMLLKVMLKPIKVMITCKILGPYLKNSARYRDLKNLS